MRRRIDIKPGREVSKMSFAGSVVAVVFGCFWTVMAFTMTGSAPGPIHLIFPLFGVCFVGMGIYQAAYALKNTNKNEEERYSVMEIVETVEEEKGNPTGNVYMSPNSSYCPFCGAPLQADFKFCPKCGKSK